MPSVQDNLVTWDQTYSWHDGGDEWSQPWGDTESQWRHTIEPRIRRFLPAGTILEISPGYGRWTQYLKDRCERLIVVDLAGRCIQACKERFSSDSNITYVVNDGRSLAMLEDGSVDFAFSFDSLPHCDADVITSYLAELARVLKPDGVGFIHHSNAAAHAWVYRFVARHPNIRDFLQEHFVVNWLSWRAMDMTAERFEQTCRSVGLQCIQQELVNWRSLLLSDCLSTFVAPRSPHAGPNRVVRNRGFMREAASARRLAGARQSQR
jgi:ubiquinone/menaquinone biosynthesis C-methylase UbiE